jgi:thymidylate synthase (FAD)
MTNKVVLIGHYGGDITHAQSAWTSTDRELTHDKEERIPQLLSMLASEGHHTPFEKSLLHFIITADIASHIHMLKHRVGVSINTESARYKELKDDKYYLPADWSSVESTALQQHCFDSFEKYHNTLNRLTPILGRKRAKETARFYLPYATQLVFDVSFNFRSFYHFLSLRNKPDAQIEVREIAQQMLDLVKGIEDFKHTIQAFEL